MTETWLKITINIICSQFAVLMLAKIENKREKHLPDYRLFELMLISICILLISHSLVLLTNGSTAGIRLVLLRISVSVLFPMAGIMVMTYAIYIDKLVNSEKRRPVSWFFPYFIPLFLIVGFNIASEYTGWFFGFDELGYFHTGRFIYIPIILCFGYVFSAMIMVLKHKKNMNSREYANLLSVPIPMIVAGSLQSFFNEYPILLPGCALSLFLVFSNIQERRLSYDHLTGAYNRQKLDEFLEGMMESARRTGKGFSAFLADVNQFKSINDNFGHSEGDRALITVVNTIQKEIRSNDFLARYAGDEFVAVFPSCSDKELVEIVSRIHQRFSAFTDRTNRYPLGISIGAAVFDPHLDGDPDQYIKRLDNLMYIEKKASKAGR